MGKELNNKVWTQPGFFHCITNLSSASYKHQIRKNVNIISVWAASQSNTVEILNCFYT
ncbi:hypothetical protein SLEP1_g50010 [Rubroshorea leprosula]|uniref:Uncharacterized protein n=1 Tax=Rubroshorea leprosula TaxID=152421 RepID=A0AAV5M1Z6_9ROSI|nr:hypothetical protein SLEP1_g50010 [Rubroshorea leprosula]